MSGLPPVALAVAIGAYLLGSVPFGLLLTRAAGLGDIRRVGSGNIGATNVLRTGRRGLAAATLLLDGLKGAVAIWLAVAAWPVSLSASVAAVCVILGHCFPVWLRFAGGKGVATLLGVALALDWRAGVVCCLLWLLVARLTRISSAGGIAAAVALPVMLFGLAHGNTGNPVPYAGLLSALLVLARHHANIGRLIAGTEPRIGRPRPGPTA
ncbi:glycerol-3-phosphate 1-O-acyltransferase PlsY [Lichenicoccus roseus]|uniref:Glycerol-3-phosphate acyltransferase n=1 Tax=Lichenicoccus roseus TaxID=2683649 RepID=A0A5R9JBU5_9PROT|nr:glycerol-3-phosphate 1-O-acyltransferase PlsY [Lichenicoccus roseus]TLU74007.1 glycerol-3-phosphate 1-O-acyltransferase PlsY [Lichenicoccus roseus]